MFHTTYIQAEVIDFATQTIPSINQYFQYGCSLRILGPRPFLDRTFKFQPDNGSMSNETKRFYYPDQNLSRIFDSLTHEARDLYLPEKVPEIFGSPTPLEFYRNWVSPNIPVIFRNSINHWPALHKWTSSYLRKKLGGKRISVAVTPNGMADAVYNNRFVLPEERKIPFSEFLDIMESPESSGNSGIFYIQKQNGNFTEEFSEINDDAETELRWATEAFGNPPDAVNFWMGDSRAVTSLHKDHYENLYCVIAGKKTFILYPPTDLPYIPYCNYQQSYYKQNASGKFEVIDDPITQTPEEKIPWIPVDPLKPDLETFPEFGSAQSITCTIGAGDVLYLPSLWFHHVKQTHATIAINFWYDMEYDIKYNYFKFLENIVKVVEN